MVNSAEIFLEVYYEINTVERNYAKKNNEERTLLCGLYQYDIMLHHDSKWNPNLIIDDI